MNIYTLVFLYCYVSVCVVLFDLVFTLFQERSEKSLPKRIEILEHSMGLTSACDNEKLQRHDVQSLLNKKEYIIAFGELLKQHEDDAQFIAWCNENISLFASIAMRYSKYSTEYKAYVAYLLVNLPLDVHSGVLGADGQRDIDVIAEIMTMQVDNQSVYLRENSFKALLRLGNANNILTALEVLNNNEAYQNEKLLTDNLLRFEGNEAELVAGMWNRFEAYSTTIQVVFINYMRLLRYNTINQEEYSEQFFAALNSDKTHKEVKLAIIRYYRKYKYDKMYDILIQMLEDYSDLNWEYAAVAATTLASYPGERTISSLKKAVVSRNWYLRLNASESLISLGEDCNAMLERTSDGYAGEMLKYRLQVHEMKMKGRTTA